MRTLTLAALAAVAVPLLSGAVATVSPAHAQAAASVATANLQVAVQDTNAFRTAMDQLKQTYAQLIQQTQAREQALQNELNGMVQRLQQAAAQPGANQAALQQQSAQIQARQDAAENELERMSAPLQRAQAYVEEQITQQLDPALTTVMNAARVTMLIQPQAIIRITSQQVDLTKQITTELNRLVSKVNTNVPANWQPGQGGAAAQAPAPAQGSSRPQPQGR